MELQFNELNGIETEMRGDDTKRNGNTKKRIEQKWQCKEGEGLEMARIRAA